MVKHTTTVTRNLQTSTQKWVRPFAPPPQKKKNLSFSQITTIFLDFRFYNHKQEVEKRYKYDHECIQDVS